MTLGDLEHYAKALDIKHFRGVFMRDMLPEGRPHQIECGIINLGDMYSSGTHWTCYMKKGKNKIYFDSFGDARPPLELVRYLGKSNIKYDTDRIQSFEDPPICGHLCLEVLRMFSKGEELDNISCKIKDDKYIWKSWFNV